MAIGEDRAIRGKLHHQVAVEKLNSRRGPRKKWENANKGANGNCLALVEEGRW